ncbi:hypothetical protein SCA6_016107 [Theobroma cacao]
MAFVSTEVDAVVASARKHQGIHGTSYKLLHDETKELVMSFDEAWSKSMTLDSSYCATCRTLIYQMLQNRGKQLGGG